MAFRDIDYSLRVNGDLSVPSNSLKVGSNITLNSADGKVTATKFAGDGALLTNLPSAEMPDVLKIDGSRNMTGNLVIAKAGATITLRSPTNAADSSGLELLETGASYAAVDANGFKLGYNGASNDLYLSSKYTGTEKTHLTITRLGDMQIGGSVSVTGSITSTGTINGVNIASLKTSYDSHLHDDRYYTETEMDTKLGGKSDTSHDHDTVYSKLTHSHSWGQVTGKPTTFTASPHGHAMSDITGLSAELTGKSDAGHLHDDRYYTETEMNTKLATKSDTTHAHTWAEVTGKPTTFAPSSHTHDDRYYTETEMDAKLGGKLDNGDIVMNTNPFGGKSLFINSVNNAMFRAESRWIVTGEIRKTADNTVVRTLAESSLRVLFDGSYETYVKLIAGEYLYLHIDFNGGQYPGYPYGNLYLSHYNTNHSAEAKLRVYSNYASHGVGWHEMPFEDYVKGASNYISKARNSKYAISQMEFLIYAPATGETSVTQIDWQLDRPGDNEMPMVDKYKDNNLYSSLSFRNMENQLKATISEQGLAEFSGVTVNGVSPSLEGHTHDDRYYTESEVNTKLNTKSDSDHTHAFASLTSRPTTLSGYGITDAAAGNHTHAFSAITSKPTTLSGYGITDAATSSHNHDTRYAPIVHNHDTDYAAKSHNHTGVYAPLSHHHDGDYSSRGSNPQSILALDKRTWTPTEVSSGKREMQFTFTTLNNVSGTYADGIVMSTYADASGGGNNMILAAKDGSGLYLRYGEWNATSWAWTKRLAFDDEKADKDTSIIAGTGLTGGGSLSASRTINVQFGTTATTVAVGNHGHAISGISGLQAALDSKSDTSHTHAYSSITGKPTTLSGYGITDASLSSHKHDSDYLKLSGGTVIGKTVIEGSFQNHLELSRTGVSNWQLTPTTRANGGLAFITADGVAQFYMGDDNNFYIGGQTNYAWHRGNFTPASKADLSALNAHINSSAIHKNWGSWDTNGDQDLRAHGKRAFVGNLSANKLYINYGTDFANGVEIAGTLTNNGNQVWHAGNFSPSTYVSTGTGQAVGGGFSVKGRLLVGNVAGVSGDAIVYDDSGNATIHLDGNASGIESSSSTKIHLMGNGSAMFKETVTARILTATASANVPSLTVTNINNVSEKNFTKNEAIADNTGWGIIAGLEGLAYGGELHVEPGFGYTKSGRRVEVTARAKVAMTPAPQSGTRYDILYVKGPSASTEEGNLAYFEGAVGGGAASSLSNGALSDAIILATVKREMVQASITQSDVDNSVRDTGTNTGRKPLFVDAATNDVKVRYELHANKLKEDGKYLNVIYATLAGGNTFTSNQKFDGRVHINATNSLGGSATSANYGLRVGTNSAYLAMDGDEIISTSALLLKATAAATLQGTSIALEGKVKASSNATTVAIPAGARSVTWTHSYGNTNYAVNLTSNSFERHIRWTSKTANSVVIEIDDPSGQETLVDCILIGY